MKNKDRLSPGYASRVIERFKEETKQQLLHSPLFRKQVLDMLPRCWDPEAEQPSRVIVHDQPVRSIPITHFRRYRKKTQNESEENKIILEPCMHACMESEKAHGKFHVVEGKSIIPILVENLNESMKMIGIIQTGLTWVNGEL